jgi:replicative DNA helicase
VSFVGRPAAGKTWKVLKVALHNWLKGRNVLFASMEMRNIVIAQRLAAMQGRKNLGQLMKAMMSTTAFQSLMGSLETAAEMERAFWLLDGNLAATAEDLIMYCRQLKPSALFVDGAYLLRHPNPRASKFDKITDNAEIMKQRIATDLGIPVVASYQLNREAVKKNGKGKSSPEGAGLEDIYGTDAIAQLGTIVLGLHQEESVETMQGRVVSIMKGRNGEVGQFPINWDFQGMDFSEKVEEDPEDLQFL